ncbi:MAG: arginyltransferase [Pseudoxanthomonas suwonensis]|nr:arginyltransferase [Pseudoxanthomonas suwonensis]
MREAAPLQLYRTADHGCGYFDGRIACDLVLDPAAPDLDRHYGTALAWGFRRSGDILYRPHCRDCQACIAVRVPVARFRPNRSQRRCLAGNADLEARVVAPQRSEEQLALYRRYLGSRHHGGGMDHHGASEFDQFLIGRWSTTRFLELRERGSRQLLAVAVTDVTDAGLSAVYTFFEPRSASRGLGTFAILQQLAWARREGIEQLYMGYWIQGHAKMDYKRRFQPMEGFIGHQWQPLSGVTG